MAAQSNPNEHFRLIYARFFLFHDKFMPIIVWITMENRYNYMLDAMSRLLCNRLKSINLYIQIVFKCAMRPIHSLLFDPSPSSSSSSYSSYCACNCLIPFVFFWASLSLSLYCPIKMIWSLLIGRIISSYDSATHRSQYFHSLSIGRLSFCWKWYSIQLLFGFINKLNNCVYSVVLHKNTHTHYK